MNSKPTAQSLLFALKRVALGAALITAGLAFHATSQAQQLYRIVGADGRVTFSDQPPPSSANSPKAWAMRLCPLSCALWCSAFR